MTHMLTWQKKGERGQVLVAVLILMLVSALLIAPLMTFMYSGRTATNRNDDRLKELYAADAGIEYGISLLQQKTGVSPAIPITNGQAEAYEPPNPNLNGRELGRTWITCDNVDSGLYRIQSSAATIMPTTPGTGIDSLVRVVTFQDFTKNAITSKGNVTLRPNSNVIGPIQLNGKIYDQSSDKAAHPVSYATVQGWPTDQDMINFYSADVASAPAWPYGNPVYVNTLVPQNPPTPNIIGANYYSGNLVFDNTKTISAACFDNTTATPGTLYVNGNLTFNQSGGKTYYIYLNGQTIFATGDISFPSNSVVLVGPGAIIALGDINFQPSLQGDGYIFVMSVDGSVNFSPHGNFYGSVAGNVQVTMWPGYQFTWNSPPPPLNIPWQNAKHNVISQIVTWNISTNRPFIVTSSLPEGGVNVPYSSGTLVADGGTRPYTWSISSGSLPYGLELNASSGNISGTPTKAGTYSFTVDLKDNAGNSVTRGFSITINALTIVSTYLMNGYVGYPYTDYLRAAGAAPPFTWSVPPNSLPPGLTLSTYDSTAALISGDPTLPGTYNFTGTVTDSASPANTASRAFSINVGDPPIIATDNASTIGNAFATLNGTLQSVGSVTTPIDVYFQYGFDTSYGSATSSQQIVWGGFPTGFATTITGLTSGRTYYFRAVAETSDGLTVYGNDEQFTTPSG